VSKKGPQAVIVIDTREQLPYRFKEKPVIFASLKAGDYSLKGFEDEIAIERKQLNDLFSSLGKERERFMKEMERLSSYTVKALIIEGNMKDVVSPVKSYSRLHPSSIVGSLVKLIVMGIPVIFAGGRRMGEELTQRILTKFLEVRRNG